MIIMGSLFESGWVICWCLNSWIFLVAVSNWLIDPLHTTFFLDTLFLWICHEVLPKEASELYLNLRLYLLFFFLEPHVSRAKTSLFTPNIRRTLFYLYRIRSVKQSLRLVIPRAQNLTFIVLFMQKVANWKRVGQGGV